MDIDLSLDRLKKSDSEVFVINGDRMWGSEGKKKEIEIIPGYPMALIQGDYEKVKRVKLPDHSWRKLK